MAVIDPDSEVNVGPAFSNSDLEMIASNDKIKEDKARIGEEEVLN